jgi:hypothetical protein
MTTEHDRQQYPIYLYAFRFRESQRHSRRSITAHDEPSDRARELNIGYAARMLRPCTQLPALNGRERPSKTSILTT